ncbi:MAG: ABC transporter ATP-binding protein [Candidatus Thermoplasmatota archaeon]|uniref:ABC transporter ATP-binding protein n=1 Tax=Candidatus Sysuiplasma superficiale TaxID=2823368 RepID=A0A8J7YN13_9ARCH|nr:ABC transporter ATP-binding protein [Candidatus Sysuiplasma superficiale]MCL4346337.1 ABC transporter ATP-binding protein [Candidatus Thermoplasmatota archaeon]
MISCTGLTKVYGKSSRKALDSVTFRITGKGIFVLIGRNGSGKTTMVRILSTELEPTSGTVTIDGVNVVENPAEIRNRIAIVPQEARTINWMTPMQTAFSYLLWRGFSRTEAKQRASNALEDLGMGKYAHSLNRTLSGGMKRKVLVATVLASEADIVFLDEPTTGLDPISRREFWEILRRTSANRFVFLTTHYLEEAEALADEIGILDVGRMVRIGTLQSLRKSIDFNFSLRIPVGQQFSMPRVERGEVFHSKEETHILTVEEEAYNISRELAKSGTRFTINPVSLEDIFFYLIGGADNMAGTVGGEDDGC